MEGNDIYYLRYNDSPFFVMDVSENGDFIHNQSRVYLPVISDDNIVALIVSHKKEGSYSFSCGQYFADGLNLLDEEFVVLVDDEDNVFSLDAEGDFELLHGVVGYYVMNTQAGQVEYNIYSPTNCYFSSSSGARQYLWTQSITIN